MQALPVCLNNMQSNMQIAEKVLYTTTFELIL